MTDLERHYHETRDARDGEYWQFTRRANYSPVRMTELSLATEQARRAWETQRRIRQL